MISLQDFTQHVYCYALQDTEAHLLKTVFAPLGLDANEKAAETANLKDNGESRNEKKETTGPFHYSKVFSSPPSFTTMRYTGNGVTAATECLPTPDPSQSVDTTPEPNAPLSFLEYQRFLLGTPTSSSSSLFGNDTEQIQYNESFPNVYRHHLKRYYEDCLSSQPPLLYRAPTTLKAYSLPYCLALQPQPWTLEGWSIPLDVKDEGAAHRPPTLLSQRLFQSLNTVVVDAGCGEAVLRGSDVYAPGIVTAREHFSTGDVVHLAVVVQRVRHTEGVGPFLYRCITQRGVKLPDAVYQPWTPQEEGEHFTVLLGWGIARQGWKDILNKKCHGLAIQTYGTARGQPSHSWLETHWNTFLGAGNREIPLKATKSSLFLQNFSSMVPVSLLVRRLHFRSPSHGGREAMPLLRVLDCCAAPGGKTSLLLSLLQEASVEQCGRGDQFHLTCCERSQPRFKRLVQFIEEHFKEGEERQPSTSTAAEVSPSLASVMHFVRGDINKIAKRFLEREKNKEGKEGTPVGMVKDASPLTAAFHAVLVDPCCTGLGLRPKLLPHPHTVKDVLDSADYQRKLFDTAYRLLERNQPDRRMKLDAGWTITGEEEENTRRNFIAYSTCTITVEENEETVLYFLKRYHNLLLCRAEGEEERRLTHPSSSSPLSPNGEHGNPRFLLQKEILAIQREKERKLFPHSYRTAEEGEEEEEDSLLVLRFMPPVWGSSPAEAVDDSVGFFVALFEVL